jgi:plasmid stabilization system protein ParE
MEAIYEFIDAEASESAFAWFNDLAREIYSLERFPERGAVIRESKKLHHRLFGKTPSTYRIIYAVDRRNNVVNVLHIRHGARATLSTKEERQLQHYSSRSAVALLMGFPSSTHQDIHVLRTSKMKTRPRRFEFPEIG